MKTFLITVLGVFLQAQAWAGLPTHWINEGSRTVYWVPEAVATLKLIKLEADPDYWDQLELETSYPVDAMNAQVAELRAAYPDYELHRVIVQKQGAAEIRLSTGSEVFVALMQNAPAGPYLRWGTFISKAKSAQVRAQFMNPDFLKIDAQTTANVPEWKVVERLELPTSVCKEYGADVKTVYDIVKRVPSIFEMIGKLDSKFPSTKEALSRRLISHCFEFLNVNNGPFTFTEMLTTEAVSILPAYPIYGETKREVPTQKSVDFKYSTTKDAL